MKVLLLVILAAVVTSGLVVGVSGFRGFGRGVEGPAAPVRLEAAQRGGLIEFVTAPGIIEPKTKVSISARVSARIVALPCEEGTEVTKGGTGPDGMAEPSLLVKLDSKDLEAMLEQTKARRNAQAASIEVEKARIAGQRADLRATQIDLDQALRDLKRQEELLTSKDVSESTVDDLRSAAESLRARIESTAHAIESAEKNLLVLEHNVQAADADIARAEDQLAYTTIYSPIEGVVTRLDSEVGELAIVGITNSPGTVIMEVADLSRMILKAQVDEADIGAVRLGQRAKVRVQAYPDRVFDGSVTGIALTATEQPTKHFEVEVLLDTAGDRIFSGLTADVDIEVQEHTGVLRVPSQAVLGRLVDELPGDVTADDTLIDRGKAIAAVVYRAIGGEAVVTPVKIGPSDATHTVIEAGLTDGEPVIIGPYKVLENLTHRQRVVDEKQVTEEQRRAYFQSINRPFDPQRGDRRRDSEQ